jgi:GAF domain-containing protein
MSATAEMPYFIRPSKKLSASEKEAAYQKALNAIALNLAGENNMLVKMTTISCLLKTYLPYHYWVGFYVVDNGRLVVGPYQGTLGCLYIDFERGVCGKAARERKTQIVSDVHALSSTAHIACDPNSASEIVVPVLDHRGALMAVLDVDSTETASFDTIDQRYLEELVAIHFAKDKLKLKYD